LADRWITHVKEAEEKTAEVGKVGNAASGSSLRGINELQEAIKDNKVFGRDREEKINIDEPVGEEPAESQEKPVNGSGGSDHGEPLVWRENDRADPCSNPAEEKVKKKLPGTPVVFELSAKHPKGEEVEEDMLKASMKEDIGKKLPQIECFPDKKGDQTEKSFDP
jgi:hypothetical protein